MINGKHFVGDPMVAVYMPHYQAAVTFEKPKGKPTNTYVKPENKTRKVAFWGSDNNFPQTIKELAEKSSLIAPTIDWKVRAMHGLGIHPFKLIDYKDDGSPIYEALKKGALLKEIQDFFRRTNINRYLLESSVDFYWFFNVFPEFVLSNDRQKITSITLQDAMFCRWEEQNPNTGIVENCYISSFWPQWNEDHTTTVPVIDIYDAYRVEKLRDDSRYKYIYPVSYPTPGKVYYQLAHWDGVRQSGWLEFSLEIPKWKKGLMTNQITLKYHIAVPSYWWEWKYPQWNTFTEKEQAEKRTAELDSFNSLLQGSEKAGKTLMTTFYYDETMKKEYPGWKISPIETKLGEGSYIEDSEEANAHILYAHGVDKTLIGYGGKNAQGAGSGSDKHVAMKIYRSMLFAHQQCILEPLQFIADYNGWNEENDLVFRYIEPPFADPEKEDPKTVRPLREEKATA